MHGTTVKIMENWFSIYKFSPNAQFFKESITFVNWEVHVITSDYIMLLSTALLMQFMLYTTTNCY